MHLVTGEGCKSASGYRREMHECIRLQEKVVKRLIMHLVTGESYKSASGYRRGLHSCSPLL